MISREEIERAVRELNVKTRSATDACILADASAALARGSTRPEAGAVKDRIARSDNSEPRKTTWRTIMDHKKAAVAFAAAACVAAVTIAFVFAYRVPSDAVQSPSRQSANPPAVNAASEENGRTIDSKPGPTGDRLEVLTRRPLKQCVAEAEVIVVATPLDFALVPLKRPRDVPEYATRYRVIRILKGNLAEKVLTIRSPFPPVGASPDENAGREWILLLSPEYLAGKHPYAGCLSIKAEPEVRAILSDGGEAPSP